MQSCNCLGFGIVKNTSQRNWRIVFAKRVMVLDPVGASDLWHGSTAMQPRARERLLILMGVPLQRKVSWPVPEHLTTSRACILGLRSWRCSF